MGLLLIAAGGVFALLFVANALLQTLRRHNRIGFWHTALAFLAVLLPVAGLVVANFNPEAPALPGRLALAIAGALLLSGLALSLLELFRPERLKASRGVFAAGAGALLLVASFSVPFTAAYTLLALPPTPTLPVAVAARGTPTPLAESDEEQARAVFREVLRIIADQAGMQPETVAVRLDQGDTVAELISANGGDLDRVVSAITDVMRQQIRLLAAEGRINAAQAALALSQTENIIRFAVNRRFEDGRLTDFLAGTPAAASAEPAPPTAALTLTPTTTPTSTATAMPSRTPAPPTAMPTRWQYATRTPTPTATLPMPCLALTLYNLNLRAAPSRDAALQLTIPYNTTLMVYGRTADSGWWFVEYEGRTGWVDGQYVQAASACAALPVRSAP